VLTWRRRPEPGTTALTVLLLAIALWTGSYALALLSPTRELRLLVERFVWTGAVVTPLAWIVFALQYTGHGDRVTRRLVASLAVPLGVTGLLVWTNPLHSLVWTNEVFYRTGGLLLLDQQFQPYFWVHLGYSYTLVLAGVILLLRLVLTADHLFADQALALLIGALVPLAANLGTVFRLAPLPGLNLTPYAFAVSAVAFGYAFFHSSLLDRIPATRRIGRNAVVKNMRDGVLVVDDDDHIVDINPVAEQLFDCEGEDVLGDHVDVLLGDADCDLPADGETVVCTVQGYRKFEIRGAVLDDQHDREVGRVLAVRDITDRSNRRQQLQVLNRVLRHNFRNDMNVIDVCATQLSDRLDGDEAEMADRIRMVARDLAETGTKAREIERIMSRRENEPQALDLPSVVNRQLDTIRHEYPDVTVETDMPEELEIRSTGILESILQNVLENAVVHNDSADPAVAVDVEFVENDPDRIEVSVADNGPGIPEQERDVLVKGTESPLEHGSGLGLWLVNWGVTMLGGEVTFEDNEPRGSVVTITIPQHQQRVADPTGAADRYYIDAD
jgi:signal transduction histidine kinase